MKEKIIIFIIGLLTGAIISTASIYFYTLANNQNNNLNNNSQFPGEKKDFNFDGNRPQMPLEDNNQNSK